METVNKWIIFSLLLCLFLFSTAQTEEQLVISADRPGVGTGADIMPFKKVQWETGVGYNCEEIEGITQRTYTLNNSLFRYGLTSFAEIRFDFNAVYLPSENDLYGIEPLVIGTKIKLLDNEKCHTKLSLLANLQLPVGSSELIADHLAPSLYLLGQNDLGKNFSLSYNVGCEFDGDTPIPSYFVALGLSYSITEKWGCFAESYNNFAKKIDPRCCIDFGITWLVHNKVQLDIAADIGLTLNMYNISCGVAWLIN